MRRTNLAAQLGGMSMLYPDIFSSLEAVRWNMQEDIPWGSFEANHLTEEQAVSIKMNAIVEWAALPATEMFLRDNHHDSDFCAFMSIWFYEEQKTFLGADRVLASLSSRSCAKHR